MKRPKVVVIGGGTGSYTVLSGLKKYDLDITSIVNVTDSGGSTGRLRDEFGYLPVGDFRMAMAALADTNGDGDVLRELFMYRFDRGVGLRGHNFGNLLLTALSDIFNSESKAFAYASKILRIKGQVLPITTEDITLIAEYENGKIIMGETNIDEPNHKHDGKLKIEKLFIQPNARIDKRAKEAILNADVIVLGPGDLYTSTIANLVVGGVSSVIKKSKAKVVYFLNLINRYAQTYGFKASDHVAELKKYLKKYPEYVFINNSKLPSDILKKYEQEKGFPVENDLTENKNYKLVNLDLLAKKEIKKSSGDVLHRSLLRHDPDKLAKAIFKIL